MKKYLLIIISLTIYNIVTAQNAATSIWTDAFGIQDTVLKIPTVLDGSGNLYVAGSSIDSLTGPNIAIKKYDQYGEPLFVINYSGTGNYRDQATALAVDNNQNLIVAGFSYINSTNSYDFLVLKYDSTGTLLWTYTYNGTGSAADIVSAIVIDTTNIYITGASIGYLQGFNYVTIKLNGSGTQVWLNSYNYLGNDIPFAIEIADNNIFVNGASQSTITNYDYARIQYTPSGTTVDTLRSTGVGFNKVTQAVTDTYGNVYITGAESTMSNGFDYKTIKLDSQGFLIWTRTFDNTSHQDDIANAITIDVNGNVFVTGQSENSTGNTDYCTIKYDSLGTVIWTRYYNNNYNDEPKAIIVDAENNVLVTGSSNNAANKDFATIAYSTDGDTLWVKRFNGLFNGQDYATSIIEKNGFVYVTGQSQINSTQYQNVTIAYGQAKIEEIPDLFNEEKGANIWFLPNNGQFPLDSANHIQYNVPNHYPSLYFNVFGLSYVFRSIDNDTSTTDTLHRIDMNFMRGEQVCKNIYYPSKVQSKHYNNYYLPICPNGVIDVYGHDLLFVDDLYKKIDLYYSSNARGLKHYFVLEPGAKVKEIGIKFNGADSVSTPIGKYTIHSSIGKLEYDSLIAYEMDAAGNIISGTAQTLQLFVDSIGIHHFTQFSYNTSNYLVILAKQQLQPQVSSSSQNLIWSTYFGGGGISTLYKSVVSSNEDLFVSGTDVSSLNLFPITVGAFQTSIGGSEDLTISKFDKFRNLVFSTYYGGSYAETPRDMMLKENNGSLYITGRTASSSFPIFSKAGALNRTFYGVDDGFVLQLNALNGYPIWSTFIGSSNRDEGSSLVSKNNGFFLLGFTQGNDFLIQPKAGAYNNGTLAGDADLTITEFDVDDNVIWSTLIGGNGTDYSRSSALGTSGNLVISAMSNSSNFPTTDPNNGLAFYDNSNNGGYDVIMIEFSNLGTINWCTYIGGAFDDWAAPASGCVIKSNGNIGVGGVLFGVGFPTIDYNNSDFYQDFYGGGSTDAFYMEFNTNYELIFSTYIGNTGWDEIAGIYNDWADNVYFTGTTSSQNFTTINFSNSYYTQSFEGSNNPFGGDVIIGCISNSFNLIWSTYLGGTGTNSNSGLDLGYNISVGGVGFDRLWLVGGTGSSNPKYPCIDPGNGAYFQNGFQSALVNTPIANGIISEFDISLMTGIKYIDKELMSYVYPNPTSDKISFKLEKNNVYKNYQVFSMNGSIVFSGLIPKINYFTIDVSSLKPGIFLLKLINGNGTYETFKFEKN
jgi:hypothetical protein